MSGCRRVEKGTCITVVMKGLRILRVEGGRELVSPGFSVFLGKEL